jgi:hypothetical protein
MHDRIADLDELALKCQDRKAGAYLREAIACYQAGAMRAAIISTWIAVAFDFIDKINTLEVQGDAQAKKCAEEFRKIRQNSDLKGSQIFERQILDRAHKDLQLISDLEYADLIRLFEDRHRCAHPSMISDEELYQPTAEQVRYLIRSAVNSMLSQPPTSGKSALNQLEEQVRGDYFPLDKKTARAQLEAGHLRKPRPVLVRNFASVLVKTITDPTEEPKTRARAAAALNALREMHPNESNAVLAEKLSDRLRPSAIKDEHLRTALTALAQIEDGEAYVETDVRDRLTNFVTTIPNEQFASVGAAAIRVKFTREAAIERTAKLEYKYFVASVEAAAELTYENHIRQRAITMYASSTSFNEANSIARRIVMPMTQSFDKQEIEKIVNAGFLNGEVRYSHEFPAVLAALKVNENVDASWWDPLLKTQNEDNFLYDLFFHPPMLETEEPVSPSSADII